MGTELQIQPQPDTNAKSEAKLIDLVLHGVTSIHSRRSYKTGLTAFLTWIKVSGAEPAFTKALVQQYRSALLSEGLSHRPSTSGSRPYESSPVRWPTTECSIRPPPTRFDRVPGVEKRGNRVENWLMKEQANDLLNAPDPNTLTGLRDRAILAFLLGCGLRRAELLRINIDDLQ